MQYGNKEKPNKKINTIRYRSFGRAKSGAPVIKDVRCKKTKTN